MNKFIFESANPQDYLSSSEIIDFDNKKIKILAKKLRSGAKTEAALIKNIYEYVRDNIAHSGDIDGRNAPHAASETLEAKEGICYAKSNLLAALLRANGVPAGFCYQLLRKSDKNSALILHTLNAVYLKSLAKWIRLDARGNKPGVDAQFDIERERLAFCPNQENGEKDYPYVFIRPDENTISALKRHKTPKELLNNLPGKLARELD